MLCHGYRDLKDLAFCDETYSTKQKALARQVSCYTPEPRTLQPGWIHRSRQAFFALYVAGLSGTHDTLGYVRGYRPPDDTLPACIDAASLAFMSSELNNLEISRLARQQYTTALRQLGQTLQKPQSLLRDETLQSVLLLDVYEKMMHPEPQASTSWMSHILGAFSLINARGEKDRLGPILRRLAMRVVTTLSISCGVAHTPIPYQLRILQNIYGFVPSDAAFDVTGILVDVVTLRHSPMCLAEKAQRAKDLDDRLAFMENTMNQTDLQRISIAQDHPLILENYYDLYANHFATQIWNGIRMVRLEINSLILLYENHHDSDDKTRTFRTIDTLIRQICASVPQLIIPNARPDNEIPLSPLQKLQCRTVLAPLYLAHQTSSATCIREWIRRIITHMAESGSMKIAKDVLNVLETNPETNYWSVYAMTGCYALAA